MYKRLICIFLFVFVLSLAGSAAGQSGTGLRAEYYHWAGTSPPSRENAFRDLVVTRIDPQIYCYWNPGFVAVHPDGLKPDFYIQPAPGVRSDFFAVRWSGEIEALTSEAYTFITGSDDGVRMWLNGELIIEAWADQDRVETTANPVDLVAGRRYDIVVEGYENGGEAEWQLYWRTASMAREPVPQQALYPTVKAQDFPASDPVPADGAIIKDTWASLQWMAGPRAATHDVYFSNNLDDVEAGAGDGGCEPGGGCGGMEDDVGVARRGFGRREFCAECLGEWCARRNRIDQRGLGAGHPRGYECGEEADHAGADNNDLIARCRAGIPYGIERGFHVGCKCRALQWNLGRENNEISRRGDEQVLVWEEAEDRLSDKFGRALVNDARRRIAVFDWERKRARLVWRTHSLPFGLRDGATTDEPLGAAAEAGKIGADEDLIRCRLRQRLGPELDAARRRIPKGPGHLFAAGGAMLRVTGRARHGCHLGSARAGASCSLRG